ncbi:unnamed protein product, partial [Rotaria sordida]
CQAGLEILRKDGHAADAAVTIAAALNVIEQCSCEIRGARFVLFLNGGGRSPKNLT